MIGGFNGKFVVIEHEYKWHRNGGFNQANVVKCQICPFKIIITSYYGIITINIGN